MKEYHVRSHDSANWYILLDGLKNSPYQPTTNCNSKGRSDLVLSKDDLTLPHYPMTNNVTLQVRPF